MSWALLPVVLWSCSDAPEREPPLTDEVALSDLPPAFQQIVGLHTTMMRRGIYERPRQCDGFAVAGFDRQLSWEEVARLLDASLGERLGAATTVAGYDEGAVTVAIRSDSVSSDAATLTAWTLRFEGASEPGNQDAGASADGAFCVQSIEITDL